jgi:hypothetical protein
MPMEPEIEYKNLTNYFKWLVTITLGALTLIGGVAGVLLFHDVSQVKSQANSAIDQTKEDARREISSIRNDAGKIALDEARRRVDIAFETANVRDMVDQAARRHVTEEMDKRVARDITLKMSVLQQDITRFGELANLAMEARMGFRKGLEGLALRARSGQNEDDRGRARKLESTIAADYEAFHTNEVEKFSPGDILGAATLATARSGNAIDEKRPVPGLVNMIRKDQDLNNVCLAFIALRKVTGRQFAMFDFAGVEQWCTGHTQVCK